jgi:hypothetical protein
MISVWSLGCVGKENDGVWDVGHAQQDWRFGSVCDDSIYYFAPNLIDGESLAKLGRQIAFRRCCTSPFHPQRVHLLNSARLKSMRPRANPD